MVAVTHPPSRSRPAPGRSHLRLVIDNEAAIDANVDTDVDTDEAVDRDLDAAAALVPIPLGTALGLVVAAVLVFGGLFLIRAGQGAPVEGSAVGTDLPDVAAGPGDVVMVAKPGDTLWSMARQIAPGDDPRPVVDALVAANGGATVRAGQQIIVPEQLLD